MVENYSVDALNQFVEIWNDYFVRSNLSFSASSFTDSPDTPDIFPCVGYNKDHNEVEYESDVIPSTASIIVILDPAASTVNFYVEDDGLSLDLDKVVIYTDDKVINDIKVDNRHDTRNIWAITVKIVIVFFLSQIASLHQFSVLWKIIFLICDKTARNSGCLP